MPAAASATPAPNAICMACNARRPVNAPPPTTTTTLDPPPPLPSTLHVMSPPFSPLPACSPSSTSTATRTRFPDAEADPPRLLVVGSSSNEAAAAALVLASPPRAEPPRRTTPARGAAPTPAPVPAPPKLLAKQAPRRRPRQRPPRQVPAAGGARQMGAAAPAATPAARCSAPGPAATAAARCIAILFLGWLPGPGPTPAAHAAECRRLQLVRQLRFPASVRSTPHAAGAASRGRRERCPPPV